MKCKICKQKTDWDKSYGLGEFIVCPQCFESMTADVISIHKKEDIDKARAKVMSSIFLIGRQIERTKKK